MAGVYADLIEKGLKSIDDVPESLRPAVQEILDSRKPQGKPWIPIDTDTTKPIVDDGFLVDFNNQN